MNIPIVKIRKKLIEWLFMNSQHIYTKLFKKKKIAWNINRKDLLQYPKESFGKQLGQFLTKNNFEILPKLERHDCYHIITGYKTKAEDEIALQYLCFGNGKRSVYLFFVIVFGTLLLPDYSRYYFTSYQIGKNANIFHCFDYKKLLLTPLIKIRSAMFTKKQIQQLNIIQYETIKNNI